MAVVKVSTIERFLGLSTDTKPSTVRAGSTFQETDSGRLFVYHDQWVNPVIDRDFVTEVQREQITGAKILRALGEREGGAATVGEDIWRGNDLSATPAAPASHVVVPTPNSAGEQMTVISENAGDTLAGTGAQKIMVFYLDAAGAEQSEEVDMNGTTAVNMVATDIAFVQDLSTSQVGSNTVAEGNIRIYKTTDATLVYSMIAAGGNQSMMPHKMVPAGKTLLMKMWVPCEAQGKRCAIRLRADCTNEVPPVRQAGVFLFKSVAYCNQFSPGAIPLAYTIPAMSIVKASAFADAIGADTSVHWWGVLVDN